MRNQSGIKSVAAIFLCATLLLSSACKKEGSKEDVTSSLVLWGSQEEQVMLKEMVAQFVGEHPKYTVEVKVMTDEQTLAEMQADPDNAADVFSVTQDGLYSLSGQGLLLENTESANSISSDCVPAALQAATVDDKVYGYPISGTTYVLYYDTSLFAPEDVKSLENILSISSASGKAVGCNMSNNYYTSAFWFANGCKLFGASGADPEGSSYNNENGLAAANYIAGLREAGLSNYSQDAALTAFADGTLGAQIADGSAKYDFQEALGDNYGVASLPTVAIDGENKELVSFSEIRLYAVNAKSDSSRAAMQLATFLTNYSNQLTRYAKTGAIPVNKAAAADATISSDATSGAIATQLTASVAMPVIPQKVNFWSAYSMSITLDIYNGMTTDYQSALATWESLLKATVAAE